jgi:hypothetical protein
MNHPRVMWIGYTQLGGVPGVGSHVNNEWGLFEIGHWIEYVSGVKCEVCLNFMSEQENAGLYSSGKPGIREPYLRIECINLISLGLSFYPSMSRDMLCWIWVRKVKKLIAIRFCNQLLMIHHCLFSVYPKFFRNSSNHCAWTWHVTLKLNYTGRFRRICKLESCLLMSVPDVHTDNIRWAVPAASTHCHWEK